MMFAQCLQFNTHPHTHTHVGAGWSQQVEGLTLMVEMLFQHSSRVNKQQQQWVSSCMSVVKCEVDV